MPKKSSTPTPITSHTHHATRANIPTEELRDFVAEDEAAPKTLLYPRDPSLDPQLVWRGKDEQDRQPLAVPSAPIYIQETIHPHYLVEDLRAAARRDEPAQLSMFDDLYAGLDFDQRVDFYQHGQQWTNRMILGDSLLVLTSLAEKEGLKGQVQMIYLDPPYGIKFGSNWQVSTRKRDVKDGKAEDATRQPEQVRAFRDTWQLGIHSYLAYLRDRFMVARELLTETGSIFVQIGDENVHLVRSVLDEVFGSENNVASIVIRKTAGQTSELLSGTADFILWYAKSKDTVKFRALYTDKLTSDSMERYDQVELPSGLRRPLTMDEKADDKLVPTGSRRYQASATTSTKPPGDFEVPFEGRSFRPKSGYWKTGPDGFQRIAKAHRLIATSGGVLRYVRYAADFPSIEIDSIWSEIYGSVQSRSDPKVYVVQTSTAAIQRCLLMTTDPGDLVLDPTCGSGTTAYVAEQWGRRWITVDTSRVALALARTRLMAGRYPYYLLADSHEGRQKEVEVSGSRKSDDQKSNFSQKLDFSSGGDIRKGFVYKRVPHVTLKAIANNEEIDVIHARYQEQMEPIQAELNRLLGKAWEEWEIPRELSAKGSRYGEDAYSTDGKVNQLHAEWWQLRRARQAEIDASIARRADTETLYDQPYSDNKRVRVSGPFTVESLSPHRVIAPDEERPASQVSGQQAQAGRFEMMILENLKKAGVQNTYKNERLVFDRLEPYAGEWLQGEGEYTETQSSGLRYDQVPHPDNVAQSAGLRRDDVPQSSGLRYDDAPQSSGLRYDDVPQSAGLRRDDVPQSAGLRRARRVAVAIGPEHGTVGPQLIKEAAKEAVRGVGFDLLLVCGFAFDPHVAEEATRYGKLTVLTARMNPDLAMGDTLLKKTGSGNLFMVFGEPDIVIRAAGSDGFGRSGAAEAATTNGATSQVVVEIRGLDIYDPTTGEIRSSSTEDIACWFIDTDYNEETFFVRHAYFTGGDRPYDKLQKALRAEIDEDAWSALYSTVSRPFDPPATGKIAVKVINHYGDEVLKVYQV